MQADEDERLATRFKRLAVASACLAMFACLAIAAGWYFDIAALRTPLPDGGTVTFGTCALLACLDLLALTLSLSSGKGYWQWLCRLAAAAIFVMSSLKIAETMCSADFIPSIQILLPNPEQNALSFPGAISIDVCVLCSFYSLALLLALTKFRLGKNWFVYQIFALLGACMSLIPILGYISGQESLCTAYGCIKQPVVVTFISLLTAVSIIFRDTRDSALADATQANRTGHTLRAILLLVLIGFPLSYLIKTALVTSGFVDKGLGSTLALSALLAIGAKLFWSTAPSTEPRATRSQTPVMALENVSASTALPVTLAKITKEITKEVTQEIIQEITQETDTARQAPERASFVSLTCPKCKNTYAENIEICPIDGTELAIEVVDRLVGTTFAEKYRIEALLGKGGMSTVYVAKHLLMSKQVAIKLMHTCTLSNVVAVRRFQAEAKSLSRLKHPNVLQAIDFGFFDGMPYMIMDLISGESLAQTLHANGPLCLPTFFDIAAQICAGLAHAHKHGIVHRDLKPANIMLLQETGEKVQVKIVDFGLAKLSSASGEGALKLTQTGDCMGSPQYMSPEQCTSSPTDQRSDIYALGCLFYESLTGRHPITGDSILAVMQAHISQEPQAFPLKPSVPPDLQAAIFSMLAKAPTQRPQSIDEVSSALMHAQASAKLLL